MEVLKARLRYRWIRWLHDHYLCRKAWLGYTCHGRDNYNECR
jgi:hypothetical protein